MKHFLLTLAFLITLCSCNKNNNTNNRLINFAPTNASTIIKTSNFESFKNTLSNNNFFQKISKHKSYKNLKNTIEAFSFLNFSEDIILCTSKETNDSLQFSIISKYHKQLLNTDSLPNYAEEILSFEKKTITKHTINNHVFYSSLKDSIFFVSTSKKLTKNAFTNFNSDFSIEKVFNTKNTDNTCSTIINTKFSSIKNFTFDNTLPLSKFTNYLVLDTNINQDEIIINGITKATDSSESFINVFKNTIPQENQVQNITPSDSDGFMSFTFNDFKTFQKNILLFNKTDSLQTNSALFNDISEIGIIYKGNNRSIILNSIDIFSTKDALANNKNIIDSYRDVSIYSFNQPSIFIKTFSPLINFNKALVYCVLDNFFVFSNNTNNLHNIIANYQNKTTLNNESYFQNIKKDLSDESSLLFILNTPSALNRLINNNLKTPFEFNLKNYKSSALQFIYDSHFAHVNTVIKKNKIKALTNSISEELNIKLNSDILNTPQFVTNHVSKAKEITIQDVKNNLYLISNKGKTLWKKQLNGPVLGTMEQIDIYKNGKLQLAFATPNHLYVIDRNGNNVKPFPIKFKDKITQPLSVFDYDRNKKYRLLITQGENILMYDKKGKTIKGFSFKPKTGSAIISQPKHFRINKKDYLAFKTKEKIHILDRKGNTRILPKTTATYSNQPLFLYKNNFTTTSLNGSLISINTKGKSIIKPLNLSKNHHLESTSKTLVTLNENILTIRGKKTELAYGNYTKPRIFYINNKIYVSLTDLQSHKIYLYDSQSRMLPNFPIYGNSVISLDNIDKDKNLEFITKSESNSIILYQIN